MSFNWLNNIDMLSIIIGAVLGAILGALASTWYSYYIKRAKLIVGGGGNGSNRGMRYNHISITNNPGFIGFRLPETIIFGKEIHNRLEFGSLSIDRDTARECRAWLQDKHTREIIRPLWWQSDGKLLQQIDIKSGKSVSLMLFCRFEEDSAHYFVYQPKNGSVYDVEIPLDHLKFNSTKEFCISISYSNVRNPLSIKCKVTKGFERYYLHVEKSGGGTF